MVDGFDYNNSDISVSCLRHKACMHVSISIIILIPLKDIKE